MYWNAWRDDRSTWMRERRLVSSQRTRQASEDWSRIDIASMRLLEPAHGDLAPGMRFIAPDDGNADDKTVLAVPLPSPAGPGALLRIEVKWTARVPRTFARTGAVGNFFFVAHWFPKLGVLQDEGWNCHQFHSITEFFSDFGSYDVKLTVPAAWTVGATGVARERHDNADGTSTHRYYQDDVHDFAWTTSPDYLERRARFEHATLPPVELRLLLQPEHAAQAERHFESARVGLERFGEWYGAYPYGHLTIVDPAYQSGAEGMEYPTLITGGTSWIEPRRALSLEDTIIHEVGHQFWYGMVATNEFEDAWLDEGIATFSDARMLVEAYGPPRLSERYFGGFIPYVFADFALERDNVWNIRRRYRAEAKSDALSTPSYRSPSRALTYFKPVLWLHTLERWLGWPAVRQGLSTFFDKRKFQHPGPDALFQALKESAGRDLGWLDNQFYAESNVFDYGVQDLRSVAEGQQFRTTVIVRRYGEAIFPIPVVVSFANGDRVTERWDGRGRWQLYEYVRADKAAAVEVDPERVLRLDMNYTNNSRTLAPKAEAAAEKWSLKWIVWLQDCLLTWGALL
jgi:aminopeptidase N